MAKQNMDVITQAGHSSHPHALNSSSHLLDQEELHIVHNLQRNQYTEHYL